MARRIESKMGLPSNKLHDAWVTLSGGERQRAAICVGLILGAITIAHCNLPSVRNNPGAGQEPLCSLVSHYPIKHQFIFLPISQ